MAQVMKELTNLIVGVISEKKSIQQQLNEEREFRLSVDKALQRNTQLHDLTPDLMVMKICILEEQLKKLERLIQCRLNDSMYQNNNNNIPTPIP